MDALPRVLLPPQTMRLTRSQEDELVSFVLERVESTRKGMGWLGNAAYSRKSWLWNRHVASRMFELDFEHRKAEARIFERVNLSLNMVGHLIENHKSRIAKDLVGSEAFFGLMPEGPEDQSPVLRDAERWLQRRAKRLGLQETFKTAGILGAMIRGEAIAKTTLVARRKIETRIAHVQIMSDGSPVRDSEGRLVTDLDDWQDMPDNPTMKCLVRDPLVQMPVGAVPRYSQQEMDVQIPGKERREADLSFPFWSDLVVPVNATSLDNAELIAHCVELAAPDMIDALPDNTFGSALDEYKAAVMGASGNVGEPTEQGQPAEHRGEEVTTQPTWAERAGAYRERRYDEVYIRFDWRGNGRFDRLAILIDRELQWPIYYGLASEILTWTDRPHPFNVWRIMPVEGRWYGRGYYDRYGGLATFADKCWCRMEAELRRSGNLILENRDLHEAGRAGKPINFRSPETIQVVGQATMEEVLKVVTVTPQVREVAEAMNISQQRLQSEGGVMGPGDPVSQQLNKSDTLGEAKLQEANKNVTVEEREGELILGMNESLSAMAEIELDPGVLDVTALASMLESASRAEITEPLPQMMALEQGVVPMPQMAAAGMAPGMGAPVAGPPQPPQPRLTGNQRAVRLIQWAKEAGDDLRDVISVFMTRSRQSALFDRATRIIQITDKWLAYPPEVRLRLRSMFAELLRSLDVQNVDAVLGPDEPQGAPAAAGPPMSGTPPQTQPSPAVAA